MSDPASEFPTLHVSRHPAILHKLAVLRNKDTEPKTLFDEDGAWTLVEYDIDEGSFSDLDDNREDAFLLSFKKSEHVVTAGRLGTEVPIMRSTPD